ncbi:MAG: hypothetical protein OXC07_00185 [Kistimonas sp.]|nr:hypothetical protein [Kistimonas sp.]
MQKKKNQGAVSPGDRPLPPHPTPKRDHKANNLSPPGDGAPPLPDAAPSAHLRQPPTPDKPPATAGATTSNRHNPFSDPMKQQPKPPMQAHNWLEMEDNPEHAANIRSPQVATGVHEQNTQKRGGQERPQILPPPLTTQIKRTFYARCAHSGKRTREFPLAATLLQAPEPAATQLHREP